MKTKFLMMETFVTLHRSTRLTMMPSANKIIAQVLFLTIGFTSMITLGNAQNMTIISTGDTGTSGTNWSISGNTLTVTGAANIQASVIQNHLTNTGPLTIVGNTTNFQVSVTESINTVTGSNGLVFGASDNQGGITITGAISIAGSVSFYGGDILINQNLNTTAGGITGNVFVKASGDIILENNKSITTSGGNVIFWANSDGSTTNGGVFLDQSSSITTGGGHIWIGGGSGSTTWNGLTVGNGYAVSGRNLENDFAVRTAAKINWDAGVLLDETSLNSGGGNIYIAGQRNTRNNHDGGAGIINYSGTAGTTINSGNGTIEIDASGNYSLGTNGFMTGLHPTQVTGGLTITSTNALTTYAISVTATTMTSSNAGLFVEGNTQFLSTAAASGGGISINTSSAAGTGWGTWVQAGSLNVLSASGAINLNAGNSGLGLHPSTGTGFLYLGSRAGTAVTSSSAELTITADRIVTNTGSSINVASSGSLTVESAAVSFSQSVSNSQWVLGTSLTALTIGKQGNTGTIDINTALTLAGPIALYGGDINIDQNLNTSSGAANGDVLIKASGNIVQSATRIITTDGGDVILWANSDGQTADGGIFFKSGSTISTSGGHIWMGGGSSIVTWNGLTVGDGWAVSGRSVSDMGYNQPGDWQSGVAFNQTTLQSGGGHIYVAGQRNEVRTDQIGAGFANYSGTGTLIDAGTGTVVIKGDNTAAGNGVFGLMTGLHPNQYSGKFTVKSSNAAAAQAINLSGTISAGIGDGFLVESHTRLLSTAGTNGGGIAISGTATGARSALSVGIGSNSGTLEVLSASGYIDINVGTHPLLIANLGIFRLGSISGDADVSNSIANITFTSNNPAWTGNVPVRTTGALIVTPTLNGTFSSSFNTNSLNYTGITGLTIGNSSNTADITVDSETSIAGPISIYGGNIEINKNLNTTGGTAAGDILLKASGDIVLNSGKSVTTAGGDVTFWSDSDISNSGYIQIADNATVTTTGGNIILAGGADDGANNGTVSDGLPDGYAVGYGTSPYYFGVGIGKEISSSATNEGASVFSGGGDIIIRGKSGTSTSGTGIVNGSTIDSGAGTIRIIGDGNSNGHGIELGANAGSGDQTVTIKSSGGNVTTTAITISGSTTKSGQIGILSGYDYNAAHGIQILSTGTGGIAITGSSTNAGANGSIALNGTSVLSASGPVSIDAGTKKLNLAGVKAGTAASAAVYFGAAPTTVVSSSSSNITITANETSATSPGLTVNSTGALTVQPSGTSFSNALSWPINNFSVTGLTGLQLGKAGNTANITIGSTTTIAGPITLYGGSLALNGALTATNSSMNLHASGAVNQSAALTANGLGLHGTGTFTLTNTGNNVATIAGGDNTTKLGSVSYVDASGGLTIGTVNPSGITASGPILIETLTGDITVSNSVTTTDTTSDAIIINAGKSSAIGTSAGGDIKISGSPTVMTGMGGIAKLFSGSESASTGLTMLAGGSANVRGQVDETSTSFYPPLQGDNVYALYRVASLPDAPTSLVATPCGSQVSISFTAGSDGGAPITNYEYTLDGTNWTTFSPAVTVTTVTIAALPSGTYNISLRAVNSTGAGAASTSVTCTINTNVAISYTGVTIAIASNKSAQITLSATVTLPAGANASQQAQVRFINRDNGQDLSGWLSVTGTSNTGTVSHTTALTLGTHEIFRKYNIGIEVGGTGCFTRNNSADNVVITVADPGCGCY